MADEEGDRNPMIEVKITNPRVKEIDSLHFANVLYWREGPEHSREANLEHQRRKDRLKEIRAAQLAEHGL
jgi:hypothetical protein